MNLPHGSCRWRPNAPESAPKASDPAAQLWLFALHPSLATPSGPSHLPPVSSSRSFFPFAATAERCRVPGARKSVSSFMARARMLEVHLRNARRISNRCFLRRSLLGPSVPAQGEALAKGLKPGLGKSRSLRRPPPLRGLHQLRMASTLLPAPR